MNWLALFLAILAIGDIKPPVALSSPPQTEGATIYSNDAAMTDRSLFEKALRSYDEAIARGGGTNPESRRLMLGARGGFESLVQRGIRNGQLYFNIANTYFQLGHLGRAIVNYRRALKYIPGDSAVRQNLDAARKLRGITFAKPAVSDIRETLLSWHYQTSIASRIRFALAGYGAFWLVMLAGLRYGRRPLLMWTATAIGAITLAVSVSATYEQYLARYQQDGVVTAADVVLRKGNGEYYDPALVQPLPEGVEFSVRATRDDVKGALWFQVELPDGKEGWLPASTVELIQ